MAVDGLPGESEQHDRHAEGGHDGHQQGPGGLGPHPLDSGEVWTYRDPNSGDLALLLFSDAKNKPANLPPGVGIYDATWLRKFLAAHPITTVFLDIAGPHPMQADPVELLKALDA